MNCLKNKIPLAAMLLTIPVLFTFTACDDSSSAASDEPGLQSSAGMQNNSSDSSAEGDGSNRESQSSNSTVKGVAPYCKTETEDNCEYGTLVDNRDGQSYKTVKIGNQWWMAENLKFSPDSIASYCYGHQSENCDTYGRYYSWATAVGKSEEDCGHGDPCSLPSGNVQGICMDGWHVPSKDEWEILFDAVGGKSVAGKVLKAQTDWYGDKVNLDAVGFSGLPGGYKHETNYFESKTYLGIFWSSTEYLGPFTSSDEYQNGCAHMMILHYNDESAAVYKNMKPFAHNVRCLKDAD